MKAVKKAIVVVLVLILISGMLSCGKAPARPASDMVGAPSPISEGLDAIINGYEEDLASEPLSDLATDIVSDTMPYPVEEPTTEPELEINVESDAESIIVPPAEPIVEPQTMDVFLTDEVLFDVSSAEYETINWDETWVYAEFSKIHTDSVNLYRSPAEERKNIVVAINAGHGTSGGSLVKTLCHPDGSAKVTGGSTAAGETKATAVSYGTTFLDGSSEASVNLELAIVVKNMLLAHGYDVLMIRENSDTQLDNIARTVFANHNADCHIALHYDSTESDKGLFYIGVPDVKSYRAMEPVASHFEDHESLGKALLGGMKTAEVKIYGSGNIPLDLTQTSYSVVPSIDIEVGDRKSDYSVAAHEKIAKGILLGLDDFFTEPSLKE